MAALKSNRRPLDAVQSNQKQNPRMEPFDSRYHVVHQGF